LGSTDETAPYEHPWWNPPVGPYTAVVTAIDNCGNSTQKSVQFQVVSGPTPDPIPD
jgi:hypothetical protein